MRLINPSVQTAAEMIRPPCWPTGSACRNACARAYYVEAVENRRTLSGPWTGWRLAGRDLGAPDRQRITSERLRGLLFREAAEARLRQLRATRHAPIVGAATVAILPRREQCDGYA
jgi:hypothetical protein